jgi:hypothetical protein
MYASYVRRRLLRAKLTLREVGRDAGGENANSQSRKVLNESATSLIVAKTAAVMLE